MRIADKKTIIISFLNTILSDKDDKYYLVQPELTGSAKTNVGGGKKKYQYISGDYCVPYDMLNDENKINHDVIMSVFENHTNYAFIKKDYASDKLNKMVDSSEKSLQQFFNDNERVEKALNELMEALLEAKYQD